MTGGVCSYLWPDLLLSGRRTKLAESGHGRVADHIVKLKDDELTAV